MTVPSLWIFDWRKLLAYTHRWLGIAGCILFVTWFVSGVVMMYARMPGLANEERLARAQPLDLSTVTVSPAAAAQIAAVDVDRIQVGMLQGRPVYRFGGRDQLVVFADDGSFFDGISRDQALDVARRYAPGHTGPIRYAEYMTEPDQWSLQAGNRMPLHRFALDDADDTHLYVSEVTGDVVLRTTREERFWGYLGPVLHWVYFTPLRRNGALWTEFIIWSSLIGCVMCLTGIVWGLWRYSPRSRYRMKRVPTVSPYAGWMKWHHIAGLLFGLVTLTWTYSGLLSMGPFDWFRSPPPSRAEREASTGGPLKVEQLTIDSLREALAAVEMTFPVKELETTQFRGEPFWTAYRAPSAGEAARWMHSGLLPRAPLPRLEHRHVSAVHPERGAISTFGREAMTEIARAAMPAVVMQDAVWLTEYDGYYYDPRGSRTLPVLRVRYADANATWLYLDPERGGIVQRSTEVSRLRRWLYQGFHSLDFPFLYFQRPLWDIVVIVLSIGGTVLSFTTMLPAVAAAAAARTLARVLGNGVAPADGGARFGAARPGRDLGLRAGAVAERPGGGSAGRPRHRCHVTLTPRDGSAARSTRTGIDGTFLLPGVAAASYVLQVESPGFQRRRRSSCTASACRGLCTSRTASRIDHGPAEAGHYVRMNPGPAEAGHDVRVNPGPAEAGHYLRVNPGPAEAGHDVRVNPGPAEAGHDVRVNPGPAEAGHYLRVNPGPAEAGHDVRVNPGPAEAGHDLRVNPGPAEAGHYLRVNPGPAEAGHDVRVNPGPAEAGHDVRMNPGPAESGAG